MIPHHPKAVAPFLCSDSGLVRLNRVYVFNQTVG